MNSAFRLTILCSLLIHLCVYVALMVHFEDIKEQPAQSENTQTMEFVLTTPESNSPAEPPHYDDPEEPPPSKHMEDDINKANSSDGMAESGGKQSSKPKGVDTIELPESGAQSSTEAPELLSSSLSNLLQQAIKNVEIEIVNDDQNDKQSGEQLNEPNNTGDDLKMVKSPFTEMNEERARWRNMVLSRMSEQVKLVWVKPNDTSRFDTGVIKMDLDNEGYLERVWVHVPSGDRRLDDSVLRAIRSIWRFQIPKSEKFSGFYRHLKYDYQG